MLRPTLARDSQRPFKSACYILSHLSGRGSCIIEKRKSDGVDQISPPSSTIPIYSCIYRVYIHRYVDGYTVLYSSLSLWPLFVRKLLHTPKESTSFFLGESKRPFPQDARRHDVYHYILPYSTCSLTSLQYTMYIQMYMTSFQEGMSNVCPALPSNSTALLASSSA